MRATASTFKGVYIYWMNAGIAVCCLLIIIIRLRKKIEKKKNKTRNNYALSKGVRSVDDSGALRQISCLQIGH